MTLIASIPYDETIIPYLQRYAEISHEEFKFCVKCGVPFVTCKAYREDICVECSNTYNPRDREKRRVQQLEYSRYHRVRIDRRRKENKG